MSDAPERIWACVSKNTKSGVVTLLGDATFPVDGWQEYVRADRIEELLAAQPDDVAALERILRERGAVFDAMVDAAEDAAGKDVSFNVVIGRALRAALAEIKGENHDPL